MITKRSLQKFKILYKKIFGKELSDEEVIRKSDYLLNIYRAVYGSFQDLDKDKKQEK